MAARVMTLAAVVGQVVCSAECEAGMLGKIQEAIPSQCLDMCPQMCKPLGGFIAEFTKPSAVPKSMICDAKAELDCAFEADHLEECKKLLKAASDVGITLPTDQKGWEEYTQECNPEEPTVDVPASSSSQAFLASTVAPTTSAPEAKCKGDNDMVQMARSFAEDCFDTACPALCAAMEPLAEEFAKNQDRAAIEKQVCVAQEVFSCVLKPANKAACGMVVSMGKDYNVPQTEKELRQRCGGAAHDLPDSETPTSAASSLGFPMEFAASLLLLVGAWQQVA